jgi:transglutaminase-like putative cysteine protease
MGSALDTLESGRGDVGSEARARLGLVGLLAATLLGFSRVFAEGDYPGPVLLGMIAAIALAIATRRLGMSIATSSITSVGALLWYVMLIFQAKHTLFGLPTPAAFSGLVRSIGRAYANSNIDYAPVPLRPGYVALAVIALWLLASLGEVATFRLRRPLVVAVASSALFVFLLVVGQRDGASFFAIVFLVALLCYLGLESVHRLRSWGHWVSAWSSRKLYEPEVTTGPLARRMGATCVAAALVAPLFLPSIGGGILKWRNPTGPGIGAGNGQIDTLVSLAPRLIQQSKKVLFTVEATEPAYWRLVTLTRFDGNSWHPEIERKTLVHQTVAADVGPPDPGRLVEQRYRIAGLGGDLIPAASLPTVISFEGSNASEYEDDLEFNPITADIDLAGVLTEGVSYRVQSLVPNVTFDEMTRATIPSAHEFIDYPEDLPPHLPRDVFEVPPREFCPPDGPDPGEEPDCQRLDESPIFKIARRWSRGEKTPYEKLVALQERLRGFDHELPGRDDIPNDVDPKPSASADYLLKFLTETKTGYCQQFATAFAVLARMLGYPSRVSVGFLPGETQVEAPGTFTVRGNDAHAWPEVFFDEVGWVRFEPTPRSEAPPPLYTQLRPSRANLNAPEFQRGPAGAEQRRRNQQGIRGTLGEQGGGLLPRQRNRSPEWRAAFFRLAAIIGSLVVLFLLLVPSLKAALIRRRYLRAKDSPARIAAAFAEFETEAADLAEHRARSESASAFARRLARSGSVPTRPALRLAAIFEAAMYGPEWTSWPNPEEAKRLARQLRRSLWAEAGWWNRVQRLFSPAALVGANGSVSPLGRFR